MKRLRTTLLALMFVLFASLTLVACGGNDAKTLATAKENLTVDLLQNESIQKVVGDVKLPTADGKVVITWASSDPTIISVQGKVTRPAEDKTVKLTATLTLGKESDTKEFTLLVLAADTSAALAAKEALITHYEDTLESEAWKATENVELLAKINDLPIVWEVVAGGDNFTTAGVVTRPAYSAGDATIQLKATIDGTVSHTFYFLVEKLEQTVEEKIQVELDRITVVPSSSTGYQEANFEITPKVTIDGDEVDVVWTTSDATVMDAEGRIIAFGGTEDKTVVLTATITYKEKTLEKAITFKVKPVELVLQSFNEALVTANIDKEILVEDVAVYGDISAGYYLVAQDGSIAFVYGKRVPADVPTGKVFGVVGKVADYYGAYQLEVSRVQLIEDGTVGTPTHASLDYTELAALELPAAGSNVINHFAFTLSNVKVVIDADKEENYNTFIVDKDLPADTPLTKDNAVMIYYQSEIDELRAIEGVEIAKLNLIMNGYRTDKLVWYASFFNFEGDIELNLTPEQALDAAENKAKGLINDRYYVNDNITLLDQSTAVTIEWETSHPDIISLEGVVTVPETVTDVTLTLTITSTEDETERKVSITVTVGDLETSDISTLLAAANKKVFRIEGIITSFGPYNSFTMEDATGAVAFRIGGAHAATENLPFAVGTKISAIVARNAYKGLIQGELVGGSESMNKHIKVVSEENELPVAIDLDEVELTNEALLPHQSRLVNLNNLLITAYATDDYDNITMTLMRADGQTIKFKYDSRVIIENNPLTTLKVDDFVNIVAAPLSWDNGPLVMFGSSGEVVKVETISDDLKVDFDLNLFAPVGSYGQAGELVLPETGELFNSVITYAFKDAEDANNQYINLETKQVTLPEDEDAEVKLVATFVLGEVTKTKEFIVLVIKEGGDVQPETIIETFDASTATGQYGDGSFTGVNGVVWTYVHARDEGDTPIDGKGIMLRRADEPSSLSATFANGVKEISFQYRKAFTGQAARTYKVDVTNNGVTTTYDLPEFGAGTGAQTDVYTFSQVLNLTGEVTIKIYATGATGNQQAVFDNFAWVE